MDRLAHNAPNKKNKTDESSDEGRVSKALLFCIAHIQ